ncbi:MAG: hypothetical protein BGO09_13325 [Bacteroidetes bacterium 47-18]|nr:MAG: hypothetical protein BGO09_13325 [Bacteroidetes bacterium 47-18]
MHIIGKMMLLPLLLITLAAGAQQAPAKQLVKTLIEKYKKQAGISYDILYRIKSFDSESPFDIQSSVILQKRSSDTVFNSKFLYSRKDSLVDIHKYYDTKRLLVIDHNERKITEFNTARMETFPVTGNIDGSVLNIYFTDIARLEKKLANEKITTAYTDSGAYLKLTLHLPDDDEFYDRVENIYIHKPALTISRITYHVRYGDQVQQNDWQLSNIRFGAIPDKIFDSQTKPFLKAYDKETYKPLTEADYKLLDSGTVVPSISGKWYPDYQQESVLEPGGGITILDFWYTSCMPCIKAIPHLNKLQQKYGRQLRIVGVNPVENKEKDQSRISAFLQRTPMEYPILITDTIPQAYNVRGYPTLYIIDRDGKVAYAQMGTSENLYDELDALLSQLIR